MDKPGKVLRDENDGLGRRGDGLLFAEDVFKATNWPEKPIADQEGKCTATTAGPEERVERLEQALGALLKELKEEETRRHYNMVRLYSICIRNMKQPEDCRVLVNKENRNEQSIEPQCEPGRGHGIVQEHELKIFWWTRDPLNNELEQAFKELLERFGYSSYVSGYNINCQIRDLAFENKIT